MSIISKRIFINHKSMDGFILEKEIALMPLEEELNDDISVAITFEQISLDSYFVEATKSLEKSSDEEIYAFIEKSKNVIKYH